MLQRRPIVAMVLVMTIVIAPGCGGAISPPVANANARRAAVEKLPAYGAVTRERGKASFVIHVPRKRHRRGPRYVSPSTMSIGITIDPGAAQTVVTANLTPGSTDCANGVCTIVVDPTVGTHVFAVRTYDKPLTLAGAVQGNVLSLTTAQAIVRPGADNQIGIVLDGVPASLEVLADPNGDVGGSQSSGFEWYGALSADESAVYPRTFTILSFDADGNIIAGAGSPTVSITSGDTTIFQSGTPLQAGTNRVSISAASSFTLDKEALMTATVTPLAGSGASPLSSQFSMQIVARYAPAVFITDQSTPLKGPSLTGRIWAFDESGNPLTSIQNRLDASGPYDEPDGITSCAGNGNLYVVSELGNALYEFGADGTFINEISVAYDPLGITCGDFDTLYTTAQYDIVRAYNSSLVAYAPSGAWDELVSGAPPMTPWGIAFGNDSIFVSDEGTESPGSKSGSFNEYSVLGSPITDTYGIDPTGAAYFAGNSYFTMRDANEVASSTTYVPKTQFPNLRSPFGIAGDLANGYLYVVNYAVDNGTSVVTRYDQLGNPVPLPSNAFRGPLNALDIAITE